MWKKHKGELITCIFAPIVIVALLLMMVWVFEYFEIHVPGSREMWMGLIGAVIGGSFTLIGVLITIFKQEYLENEQRRLLNMPILGFEVCDVNIDDDNFVLTYTEEGLITSGFPDFEKMDVMCIKIKTVNNLPIFNFTIEGCAINGKEIRLASAFCPAKTRIVMGGEMSFIFNYSEELKNDIFCVVRFSYEDVLGNSYYQDLPFTYLEIISCEKLQRLKQFIQIRDIKQPVLSKQEAKSLKDATKEFADYEIFASISIKP